MAKCSCILYVTLVVYSLRYGIINMHPAAPHTVSRDDEVDGYLIPANSIIMGNIWFVPGLILKSSNWTYVQRAILRDPVEYPDPDRFIPERFIPVENRKCPLEPNKVVFSVGRRYVVLLVCVACIITQKSHRVCPGKHFAESSVSNLPIVFMDSYLILYL